MLSKRSTLLVFLFLSVVLTVTACSNKQVRYLASDVCLVEPDKTTKQEVLSYLGQPDEQYVEPTGEEVWVYYDAKKSMLSNTPYIGDQVGDEKFEMVTVTFNGDIVRTSVYRSMSEEEFKQYGRQE
jgi:outer membrane protein assembly factor BamE (lipoprotein component of BamABCDE complex)